MKVVMDGAGRLVVPKVLRDLVGLRAGAPIEITERGGELVLRPVGPPIHLEQRSGRKVFVTDDPTSAEDALTDEDVRRLLEESRQWPRD